MRPNQLWLSMLTAFSIIATFATSSSADVIVEFTETGGTVNLTVNGSFINLGSLPAITATTSSASSTDGFEIFSGAALRTFLTSASGAPTNDEINTPLSFNNLPFIQSGNINTGLLADPTVYVGFHSSFGSSIVSVPSGYTYGDTINVSVSGVANSLADLGLTDGDSWGVSFSDGGSGTQSLTFSASEAAAVPEPSSLGLLALGAVGLTTWRRRKKGVPEKVSETASNIT